MMTRTIPREEWAEFFDDLSDQDLDVLVTVERLDADAGDQIVVRDLPLQGITLDEKGSGAGEIEISLGDEVGGPHLSHVIKAPTRIQVLEDEDGEPQTVQIEAEGEPVTLVHFRPFSETGHLTGTPGDEDDE